MAKKWDIASKYKSIIVFNGTYEQHILIEHIKEAYEIFVPEIKKVRITSANDRKHMANSLHYKDKALDFRVWGIDSQRRFAIVTYLNWKYSDEDWLDENDHIHGEVDLKV